MTYADNKLLAHSEKNFLVVLNPARIVTSWTLQSGTVYYNNFTISDEFLEYVNDVSSDGIKLTLDTGIPTSGKYYWDWDNKRLYVNVGTNPSSKTIVVFFELYFATKTINTYRIPENNSSTVVYFAPRVLDASIPQIDQNDFLLFGSNAGSIRLNNADAKFYVYDDVSFKNKSIKIYHIIDDLLALKLIYKGKINTYSIDDKQFTLGYRQDDLLFNNQINSYFATGTDASKGFFNLTNFSSLDPRFDGYAIRIVYGVLDDLIPVNIDYNETAAINNNRDWVVRSDASNPHQLSNNVLTSPSSTTTRVYIGTNYFQIDDAVRVVINGTPEYTWVTDRGSNYIDVLPALSTPPLQSTGDACYRSSFGYIKIKDSTGAIYNLAYGRDYTENIFANNTLGFTLLDNFEANHPGLTLFDPKGQQIFCRCYGKKHLTTNDSQYGNLMAANLILIDLFDNYVGLTTNDYNLAEISGLSTFSLGMPIPERLGTTFPTYREIITSINKSILGSVYFDSNNKLSYRLLGPLSASSFTLTDKILLDFSVIFEGDDICNQITIFYDFKESPNGSTNISHRRVNAFSSMASYLHEVEKSLDIYTYLIKSSEAEIVSTRYLIIYEDWQRIYSLRLKTQLAESLIGDVVTIERSKLIGYNYDRGILRSKDVRITKLKKSLTTVEADVNDQRNLELNIGDW